MFLISKNEKKNNLLTQDCNDVRIQPNSICAHHPPTRHSTRCTTTTLSLTALLPFKLLRSCDRDHANVILHYPSPDRIFTLRISTAGPTLFPGSPVPVRLPQTFAAFVCACKTLHACWLVNARWCIAMFSKKNSLTIVTRERQCRKKMIFRCMTRGESRKAEHWHRYMPSGCSRQSTSPR